MDEQRTVCSYRAAISLGSLRCGGIGHITGMWQWLDTKLSRKVRLGQQHAFDVREQWQYIELCLGICDRPAERLCISISSGDNVVMGICHRFLIRKKKRPS